MRLIRPIGLIGLIILLGAVLRFHKLDWGQGLFTHPDEYHIVISVNQLEFPSQMNPNFFSYGTASIYLIYFSKLLLINLGISDPNIFLIGRFYSALFSTLTLFFIYKISRTLLTANCSLLTVFLAATTPGLIQQAHYATPESSLIFYIFGILYFLIAKKYYLAGIFYGLSLGVKISSIIMIIPFIYGLFMDYYRQPLTLIKHSLVSCLLSLVTLFIVAPFIYLDFQSFRNNVDYEGGLATGKEVVFYTRQFIETTPIIFQYQKIFPYVLGPILTVLGTAGFVMMIYSAIKNRSILQSLISVSFLTLLISNSLLFTKWTRFISPTFPFFAIFTAYFFYQLFKTNLSRFLLVSCLLSLVSLHLFWTLAFISIYSRDDIRITANNWINQNISQGSRISLEGGNMIDLPFSGNYQKFPLDFYQYEDSDLIRQSIIYSLSESDYFIIGSRRVFMNHQRLPNQYPLTAKFYQKMFSEQLGFKEVKVFTSYPTLKIMNIKLEIPDEVGEETWSVFDHPVIRVYQNKSKFSYEELSQKLAN